MPNDKPGTSIAKYLPAQEILDKALGKDAVEEAPTMLPTELRRIRRGKFFLSNYEQEQFGSVFRPIFEYYCHGAVVGETVVDKARDGIWCFAAHNDFELIPEFQPPSSWPEYVRTPTGWKKAETKRWTEELLQQLAETKRLGYEGENS